MDPIMLLNHLLVVLFFILRTLSSQSSSSTLSLTQPINEEVAVGHFIINIGQKLAERFPLRLDKVNYTKFKLIPSDTARLFSLRPDGILVNQKRLDYEELCQGTGVDQLFNSDVSLGNHSDYYYCSLYVKVLTIESISPSDDASTATSRLLTINIRIELIDVDDNRPNCTLISGESKVTNQPQLIQIEETTTPGSKIAQWHLNDLDSKANAIQRIVLLGSKNSGPLLTSTQLPFEARPRGSLDGPWKEEHVVLLLTSRIEYKEDNSFSSKPTFLPQDQLDRYELTLLLVDKKNDKFISSHPQFQNLYQVQRYCCSCTVRIEITDVNNHAPQWLAPPAFTQPHGQRLVEVELVENQPIKQRELVRFKAIDLDRGPNARLTYHISSRQPNSSSVILDSDKQGSDDLLIKNLLFLDQKSGSLQLRSLTFNYEQVYQLASSQEVRPGRIKLTAYVVAVDQARDISERKMSPVGQLILWLSDVNDNPPLINIIGLTENLSNKMSTSRTFKLYVRENQPSHGPIAFVSVSDSDRSSTGTNSIQCRLEDQDGDNFQLVPITNNDGSSQKESSMNYQILTVNSLDRELVSLYHLNFSCHDNVESESSLGSFQLIDVVVEDVNDNAPVILTPTSRENDLGCHVAEHAPPGTQICQFRFTDLDSHNDPREFEWYLDKSTTNEVISIDPRTGWLSVGINPTGHFFDREQQDTLNFTVYLRDGGGRANGQGVRLTSSSSVVLSIDDINDQAPKSDPFHAFSVLESEPQGFLIGTITATDADLPDTPSSTLKFHVKSLEAPTSDGDSSPTLYEQDIISDLKRDITLDESTGALYVGPRGLDRERRADYHIVVAISDGHPTGSSTNHPNNFKQNTAQTIVHITVLDENDNRPRLIYPEKGFTSISITCPSLHSLPQTIAQISANDSDSGPNAELLYLLAPITSQGTADSNTDDNSTSVDTVSDSSTTTTTSAQIDEETDNHQQNVTPELEVLPGSITLLPFQIDPQTGMLTLVSLPDDSAACNSPSDANPTVSNNSTADGMIIDYRVKVIVTDRGHQPLTTSAILAIRLTPEKYGPTPPTRDRTQYPPYEGPTESRPDDHHSHTTFTSSAHESIDYDPNFDQGITGGLLSSPNVFWAATICLAIATGILIFLITLIVLLSLSRRKKRRHHPVGIKKTIGNEPQPPGECLDASLSLKQQHHLASPNKSPINTDASRSSQASLPMTKLHRVGASDPSNDPYYDWSNTTTAPHQPTQPPFYSPPTYCRSVTPGNLYDRSSQDRQFAIDRDTYQSLMLTNDHAGQGLPGGHPRCCYVTSLTPNLISFETEYPVNEVKANNLTDIPLDHHRWQSPFEVNRSKATTLASQLTADKSSVNQVDNFVNNHHKVNKMNQGHDASYV